MTATRRALSLAVCAIAACTVNGAYRRTHSVNASTFTDFFSFFTSSDPTHGFVRYIDEQTARDAGMLRLSEGNIYMSADLKTDLNPASGPGRDSVRVGSRAAFTRGVFVIDLDHIPTGCGTWPAFWSVGPAWPSHGEIDILEGWHRATQDLSTLHTSAGCDMSGVDAGSFSGSWGKARDGRSNATDCNVNSGSQWSNQGCGIVSDDGASFGAPFNARGGGVVATVWDNDGIRMYNWARGKQPADVAAGSASVDPSAWSDRPYAKFDFGPACDSSHFSNHSLVFDLTFCGDAAGATFGQQCADTGAPSCEAFVAKGANVQEAYWVVRRVDVFQSEE